MKDTLLYKGELLWKGKIFLADLYESDDYSHLSPLVQVQAVCFLSKNEVVLFEHIDGYFSLPGGHIEQNETPEEALKRELYEEVSVRVIDFGMTGYMKASNKETPNDIEYQLRYWAKVELLNETPDPDEKVIRRVVVPIEEVNEKLNWSERGKLLVEIAQKGYNKKYK